MYKKAGEGVAAVKLLLSCSLIMEEKIFNNQYPIFNAQVKPAKLRTVQLEC